MLVRAEITVERVPQEPEAEVDQVPGRQKDGQGQTAEEAAKIAFGFSGGAGPQNLRTDQFIWASDPAGGA